MNRPKKKIFGFNIKKKDIQKSKLARKSGYIEGEKIKLLLLQIGDKLFMARVSNGTTHFCRILGFGFSIPDG